MSRLSSQASDERLSAKDYKCHHCGAVKHHHRCLCPQLETQNSRNGDAEKKSNGQAERQSASTSSQPHLTVSTNVSANRDAPMQTATALVKCQYGVAVQAHILLDGGSAKSYITIALADKLAADVSNVGTTRVSSFGTDDVQEIKTAACCVHLQLRDNSWTELKVSVVPTITKTFKRKLVTSKHLVSLNLEDLADTTMSTEPMFEVELLLGNDYYGRLLLSEKKYLGDGLYAFNTQLGWVLSGTIVSSSDCSQIVRIRPLVQ